MAEIDIRFLGEQIARMQSELRGVKADIAQLRAEQLRLEADQAQLKIDLFERIADFEQGVGARFDQVHQTMASHLEVVLSAIGAKK